MRLGVGGRETVGGFCRRCRVLAKDGKTPSMPEHTLWVSGFVVGTEPRLFPNAHQVVPVVVIIAVGELWGRDNVWGWGLAFPGALIATGKR